MSYCWRCGNPIDSVELKTRVIGYLYTVDLQPIEIVRVLHSPCDDLVQSEAH